MNYEVHLKTADIPCPVEAEKFSVDGDGYTVFYARPGPEEKFEEVQRFLTKNISKIEEKI